jgi:hypothetical protein
LEFANIVLPRKQIKSLLISISRREEEGDRGGGREGSQGKRDSGRGRGGKSRKGERREEEKKKRREDNIRKSRKKPKNTANVYFS